MRVHTQLVDSAEMTDSALAKDLGTARHGSMGASDAKADPTTAKAPARNGACAESGARGPVKAPAKPVADPQASPPRRRPPPERRWDKDELTAVLSASARHAELVKGAARVAGASPSRARVATVRRRRTGPRIAALVATVALLVPMALLTLVVKASAPTAAMSDADASFLGRQLVDADARVRSRLVRLRDAGTARAMVGTRDAVLTTRSLAIEMRSYRGAEADRLHNAIAVEREWLDAVGSTLLNPRSPLRGQLLARDAAARRALAALPADRAPRADGARHLVEYARSRQRATPGA